MITDLLIPALTWRQTLPAWLSAIANEPVRIYSIVAAALPLLALVVPALPTALVLGLVSAVLGISGQVVRSAVTPNTRVVTTTTKDHDALLEHLLADDPRS